MKIILVSLDFCEECHVMNYSTVKSELSENHTIFR